MGEWGRSREVAGHVFIRRGEQGGGEIRRRELEWAVQGVPGPPLGEMSGAWSFWGCPIRGTSDHGGPTYERWVKSGLCTAASPVSSRPQACRASKAEVTLGWAVLEGGASTTHRFYAWGHRWRGAGHGGQRLGTPPFPTLCRALGFESRSRLRRR